MRFSQKAQSAYNYKMLLRYTLCTDAPHSTVGRFCMELNVHMVHTEITGRWRTAAREWHAYYKGSKISLLVSKSYLECWE